MCVGVGDGVYIYIYEWYVCRSRRSNSLAARWICADERTALSTHITVTLKSRVGLVRVVNVQHLRLSLSGLLSSCLSRTQFSRDRVMLDNK